MVIYKATSPSGKSYIGCTVFSLSERIRGHKYSAKNKSEGLFHRAIRKYGFENIVWEELYFTDSYENLLEKEIYFIDFYNTYKKGYNLTLGGDGSRGCTGQRGKKKSKKSVKKMIETQTRLNGKAIVVISPEQEVFEFRSIAEASRKLGLDYTRLKIARRRKGSYHGYFVINKNEYDPAKSYTRKLSGNAIEFTIFNINTGELVGMKSIKRLEVFLNTSERQARNVFYKNKNYNGWEVFCG